MLYTGYTQIPHHAPVEEFSLLRSKVFFGQQLQDIRTLQDSIARYGLLSPIRAMQRHGRLIVVDGRKRLAAVKRLRFEGQLPPSLAKIPYLLITDAANDERRAPMIVSNADLYQSVVSHFRDGSTVAALTAHFQISHQCVRDILTLSRIAPQIRAMFFSKTISFAQVRAYAALPNQSHQIATFHRHGLLAKPHEILGSSAHIDTKIRAIAA